MTAVPFRCSVAGEARGDELAGTASTVRAYLLMEHPGPWGVDALRDSRMPAALGPALRRHTAAHGVRPLLIRRPGRVPKSQSPVVGSRVFAVSARSEPGIEPWIETAVVPDLEAVLDLDLAALAAGRSLGLEPHHEPLFCVCTHGRHDTCCAERGRPVAAALAAVDPDRTWECSHIGGDRFAGNVLVLPHGLYYGRLDVDSGPTMAAAHLVGRLDLQHLRGRSSLPMPVQAAEIALRLHLEEPGLDAVRLLGRDGSTGDTVARFAVGPREYAVRVRSALGADAFQLTCRAGADSPVPREEILSIERLDG